MGQQTATPPRPTVKTKRVVPAATLKKKATRLHSQYVRARAGHRCERCGRTDRQMQCAHIVSRQYTATRCDPANAWCLCATCHRYLTVNPHEHCLYAVSTRGQAGYDALIAAAYAGRGRVARREFWLEQVDLLEAALADLEGAQP